MADHAGLDRQVAHLLAGAPGPDQAAAAAVAERARRVLRPAGALARLDELAGWLAAWQGTARPAVRRPAAVVFAADHGVAGLRGQRLPGRGDRGHGQGPA